MTTTSWGHININVSNLDESIHFYEQLGFSLLIPGIPYLGLARDEPGPLAPNMAEALGIPLDSIGRACIMELGDGFPKLDLTEFSNHAGEPLTNIATGIVRLCLASRNLAEDYRALSAQGVEFVSCPREGKDGMADIACCKDPDGTLIELIELHLDKWHS